MSYTLQNPLAYFPLPTKSSAAGLCKLYVGLIDTDPLTPANQVQVYAVQPDGSELAIPQPIQLSAGGVPQYNGSPVQLKIAADVVSVKVTTSIGALVSYTPRWSTEVSAAALAAVDSAVLVGGVEAGKLAKRPNPIPSEFSANFATALSIAQSEIGGGQVISLPVGEHLSYNAFINNLQLEGQGKKSTVKAATDADYALRLGRHLPDWDWHRLVGFTIDGNSRASDGVEYFEPSIVGGPQFAGRWVFESMTFRNCDIGVNHKLGNIGNRYYNCHWQLNSIGVRHVKDPASNMHSGAQTYESCEWSSNDLAAVYIKDDQEGVGQYVFSNCIIEGNAGFGFFMDMGGSPPFCGSVLDNVWFEVNATSSGVEIDGVVYTPRDIYHKGVTMMEWRGLYVKNVELINSRVVGYNCRVDDAAGYLRVILNNSELVLHDVTSNGNTSTKPLVMSIAKNNKPTSSTADHSWRGPLSLNKQPLGSGSTLYKNSFNGAGPFPFVGSTTVSATSVSDGVVHDTCAELVIPAGATLLGPDTGIATAGKWAVWGGHFKLMSGFDGSVTFGDSDGELFGSAALIVGQWVKSYGVAKIRAGATGTSRMRIISTSPSIATLRMADFYVVQFDSEQEALNFANQHAIPK